MRGPAGGAPDLFIRRLEEETAPGVAQGAPEDVFVEAWPGLERAMEAIPPRLVEALDRVARMRDMPSIVNPNALSIAAYDADGGLILAEARFAEWIDLPHLPDFLLKENGTSGSRTFLAPEHHGQFSPVILIRKKDAPDWLWSERLRARVPNGRTAFICLALRPSRAPDVMELARSAFGLTGLEMRVTAALLDARKLPVAARRAGVAYDTAREAIASARAKAGAKSQSDLIARIISLGSGLHRPGDRTVSLLVDCFGLTQRQATLALRVAEGLSRADAAKATGVSEHVAKVELKKIYDLMNVTGAPDLSLIIAETAVLASLATATDVELQAAGEPSHPLRLVLRRDAPGQIGVADYGPPEGDPVLITHSEATGRRVARHLVEALWAEGFRPVSLERPGFGLTDPLERGRDPFELAADDMVRVLDALGINRVPVLARAGDAAALMFGHLYPERLSAGVLINPRNPDPDLFPRLTSVTTLWRMFRSRPEWIERVLRLMVRAASPGFIERSTRESLKPSPADSALLEDREIMDDYVRSVRLVGAGHTCGVAREAMAHADGWQPPRYADARHWTILIGEEDPFWDYDASSATWSDLLPDHRLVRVAEAGRFVHYSHAPLIARVLREALARS